MASATNDIVSFNQLLQINGFFGRELPPRTATTIKLVGAPFQIHQGELSQAAQTANLAETDRLEAALNAWLRSNGFRQTAKLSTDASGALKLNLDHGPLELIHAEVNHLYSRSLACPDDSDAAQQIEGVEERIFAHRTPGWVRSFHPQMLANNRPNTDGVKPGQQNPKSSVNKDNGANACPDEPDPVCTPAEQQTQLDQVAGFFVEVDSTFIADFVGSTTLYAVELCDGSIAYLLQDQLDALTGDYNILGQLPLASIDQEIVATLGIGPNPLFSMDLGYYANGNIKTSRWKTTYHAPNVYRYKYDKLNRLEEALYNPSNAGPGVGAQGVFSVSGITYDGIGNIMSLNRQGITQCGGPGGAELVVSAIDQLTYTYANGSQLSEVVDNATHPDLKDLGVKNGGGTYQYDAAGRMTHDNHRGLVIEYNHLDLPRRITDQNNVVTDITYDATGRKWLQQTATDARIYAGAVVLTKENGTYSLDAANTSDGRLVYDAEEEEVYPEFYHKDHLGNVRVAFADRNKDGKVELLGPTSEITQQNDYYPFGLRQEGDSLVFHQELSSNRYRFNGIERNEDLGLDFAFFRSYDPAIGRWLQVDPKAESFATMSPYTGMGNNPISIIDPLGDSINVYHLQQNNTSAYNDFKSQLETITGYTLAVDSKGNVTIDQKAGVRRDASGKKSGSRKARKMLGNAISSNETVTVKDNPGGKSRVTLDANGDYTNEINLDALEINGATPSSGLNPLTNDIGMVFLHELGHTPVGGGRHDPIGAGSDGDIVPGPNVKRINRIRRQLGSSYGQRMIYNSINLADYGKRQVNAYDAYSRSSLRSLRGHKSPNKSDLFYLRIIK